MPLFLALQLAVTAYLTGLIWVVQCVHYPLFDRVAPEEFRHFHRSHSLRITPVVAPMMIAELVLAAIWLVLPPPEVTPLETAVAFALVVLAWASTAFLQIPLHRRLETGFDEAAHRRLVATNWIRTAAWSLRFLWLVSLTLRSP